MVSLAFRFSRVKTPKERAHVDLETHYTKEYLDEKFESCTRRAIPYRVVFLCHETLFVNIYCLHSWLFPFEFHLYHTLYFQEYVKNISSSGMQSSCGFVRNGFTLYLLDI
ncbi:hypothetical protein VPH35_100663 [Triticum aestivum]|uniref:Uncharacterized protein n=2 Tax=Aegilops tauschii subsp. strangulata TaxID=200361 RepID=A0A453M4Q5_AEGTS